MYHKGLDNTLSALILFFGGTSYFQRHNIECKIMLGYIPNDHNTPRPAAPAATRKPLPTQRPTTLASHLRMPKKIEYRPGDGPGDRTRVFLEKKRI